MLQDKPNIGVFCQFAFRKPIGFCIRVEIRQCKPQASHDVVTVDDEGNDFDLECFVKGSWGVHGRWVAMAQI